MLEIKPKISFIIATANRAEIINDTLRSLQQQTIKDWEAVIVDNGDDQTEILVKELNDQRFRYYPLLPDHGVGMNGARNFAAILAKADIIGIMDSDDIAYANRTEVTLRAFDEHPCADIFYGGADIWEEETGIVRESKTPFTEFSIDVLKEKNFMFHSTVALKKQILLDYPYHPYFKLAEDYELYTRLAQAGKKFIFSREKIIKYRIHSGNISIGTEDLMHLRDCYGLVPRMMRGWIDFDYKIIEEIERLSK